MSSVKREFTEVERLRAVKDVVWQMSERTGASNTRSHWAIRVAMGVMRHGGSAARAVNEATRAMRTTA